MKNLAGTIALVTGAASGIGRSTSLELARAGCSLVLNDLREETLVPLDHEVQALGRETLIACADVSDPSQIEGMCRHALERFGRVDILVNNAGVAVAGRMEDVPLADWEWIMGINVWAHIYAVRTLLPGMIKRRTGHIVHVASLDGLISTGGLLPYGVTKFAVVGLAEAVAAQVRPYGIGVSVVCPAFVKTCIADNARIVGSNAEKAAALQLGRQVISKYGIGPEKVARKIVRAIRRNRFLIYTHASSRALILFRALFPQTCLGLHAHLAGRMMPPARLPQDGA